MIMRLARYDNPYRCVSYASLPASVTREPVALEAADGGISTGILYNAARRAPSSASCTRRRT